MNIIDWLFVYYRNNITTW